MLSTNEAKRLVQRSAAAESEPAKQLEEPFRQEILRLLRSGAAADGRVLVGGREALRIVSRDGRTTYLVDAGTYAPIDLRTRLRRASSSPESGRPGLGSAFTERLQGRRKIDPQHGKEEL